MKFKFLVVAMTVSLGLSGLFTSPAIAESLNDKLEENRNKQSANEEKQNETEQEIAEVKEEQNQLNREIERLDKQIMETTDKIDTKESEIETTRKNIEKLKKEIDELEKRIAERDELLKDRVKSMYQNGGAIDYLDVLMGAESFGNFLERVMSLNTIAEQDKAILEQHRLDKIAVEEKKAQVEEQLASLEEKLNQLESLKADLDGKKSEKNKLMKSLKREEEELHNHIIDLEEANETLAAQEAAIQKEIEREKERQRRAAEEAARKEAARKAAEKKSSNTSSEPDPEPAPSSNAMFSWPSAGYASSHYGQRWGRLHSGIDLAKAGTVPIRAAADGTVIRSYYSSSYGNVVFLSHRINGQTYTTVYAHMRSTPAVSAGQSVSRGQFLGNMGNTGNSTGQHLHFEIHIGSWNPSRSNSVDPRRFLP
ncbi:peptidoglycan DD-metalloendopeptidase family protein [Halobacillus yeomjeoni]|uniref:murein hydrolase activator EnvC family protein n=1 Tax=Halobacillus yeomjeoni TaxID=311194 RepID=UPI001CD1CF1E|nr:peptidoglycan DD-metalloendopeptidase family protein [Halobacillus yeomjeoni]MCA0984800.1 peptidoglycan DD-metalloendopeptidase family protein [Halobacillus yeomjeoni]